MSNRAPFERIVATLHGAALGHAPWSRASALIDEALGTHGNSMVFGAGTSDEDLQIYFARTYTWGQPRRDIDRAYFETYLPQDERVPRLRRLADSELRHITDLYTEEELKTSATYNELLVGGNGGNSVNVRLLGPDGLRISWLLLDPVEEEGWTTVQLDFIRRLLPHVRQFVHVQQTLAGARLLGATLTELLESTGIGIVQLDARGRMVAANDRARGVLRAGDILFDEKGLLFARTPSDNAELQDLLTRALPPFGARGAGGSTTMRRAGGLPPLVVHVNPAGPPETDFAVWPVAALVLIADPAVGARVDPDVASATLGLTATESRVAVWLAQGMSVREIAAQTGRREYTIRTHIRNMLAKLGLSRQADLVSLVLSLAGAVHARR